MGNPSLCSSSCKNLFCFWARIAFPKLTSEFVLRVVDVSLKFMLSDKPYQRLLLHTTRNMLMNKARRQSRISLFNSTEHCWWLILVGARPRNSVVPAPEPDTKSLTVKEMFWFYFLFQKICGK